MGIPIGTVMSGLSRARQAFRGALDQPTGRSSGSQPTEKRGLHDVNAIALRDTASCDCHTTAPSGITPMCRSTSQNSGATR